MLKHNLRLACLLLGLFPCAGAQAADLGIVRQYDVIELSLAGPSYGPEDTPARDVTLAMTFRHESGKPSVQVAGFWDGDGKGGSTGDVFKVRFCATKPGRWSVVATDSNVDKLHGQRVDDVLTCNASKNHGFWIADGRWYRRSDGSHQYIVGNTHYTFLSRRRAGNHPGGPVAKITPVETVRQNAKYYKKLRFSLTGGRYVDPTLKPFLDERGRQTDDGRFSQRPNPAWFAQRVDPVIREGLTRDLICDLILSGPDTPASRAILKGDPQPWLRYVAARYGAYPNVWFCLANEWNIKRPSYTAAEIVAAGNYVSGVLPYPTPVAVHGNRGPWDKRLNGSWHDHVILQDKIKSLDRAADVVQKSFLTGGRKPTVNDENAYQGRGDGFSKEDVVEGCLGTLLGGGYPTTGFKPVAKQDQYFWGEFDAGRHTASAHLAYLRRYVDESVEFWRLEPLPLEESIFTAAPPSFRSLGQQGREYLLGSNRRADGIRVKLPEGRWRVTQVDLLAMKTVVLAERASGTFRFNTPNSRAALTHVRRIEDK